MKRLIARIRRSIWNLARLFSYGLFRREFETPIAQWAPDIVHAHDTMALLAAYHAAQRCGAKLIFDSHELETHRNPPQLWINRLQTRKIEAKYLPQAARVITVGQKIADHLKHEYAIEYPAVIYNSPPVGNWPIPKKWQRGVRSDVRQEAGLSADTVLMVYTGNIAINRGLEETIKGLALYQDEHPTRPLIHLAVVGRAVDSTLSALKALATAHGMEERLPFPPPVAANDVTRFISSASLAVIPILPETLSYQYAMPNKLFEAMLAGLPILGTDLAEMGPFIRRHALGETYDSRSTTEFSQSLKVLLDPTDPSTVPDAERYSKLAEQFGWEHQSERLLDVYKKVLD